MTDARSSPSTDAAEVAETVTPQANVETEREGSAEPEAGPSTLPESDV